MGSLKHGTSGSCREGWPWSHRWVRILSLFCSVQMPLKRRASAGVAQAIQKAKRGRASSIAAPGPALPDPTPPVSEAVIDNIANRVLARIEERLALRLMPPKAQPPPPTAVLPNLAAQAPPGPAVQNAVVSAPMTGQLPPATGPVPNVQTGTAPPHWGVCQISTTRPTVWPRRFWRRQQHALQVITMLTHYHILLVPPHP